MMDKGRRGKKEQVELEQRKTTKHSFCPKSPFLSRHITNYNK
jgi:hypothetical protein